MEKLAKPLKMIRLRRSEVGKLNKRSHNLPFVRCSIGLIQYPAYARDCEVLINFTYNSTFVPWILDYCLGLSSLITKRTTAYWSPLFYHAHKIGHIPIVYPDAHRFHHHLHDATSFDAHIFGSSAPEEWLILLTDIVLAHYMQVCPASLGPSVLAISWYNKWGFHSRKVDPNDDGDNFHVNHHSTHVKTLAITYPYDLLMGTAMKPRVHWAGYEIFREENEDDKSYKVCFVPLDSAIGGCDNVGDEQVLKLSKRQSLSLSVSTFLAQSLRSKISSRESH